MNTVHHTVRLEQDSTGKETLARTHCGALIYYKLSSFEWTDVNCAECVSQRTLVSVHWKDSVACIKGRLPDNDSD